MEFSFLELAVSFAGGLFGAAIGALPVWILCGLAVLIGATMNFTIDNPAFMNIVAWGSFLGPHTSFAGGSAAAAYAAKKGLLQGGRDICTPLIGLNNPKVIFVGGLFGALGYVLLWAIMQVPNYSIISWTNTIALAVILNMVVARLVFGKTGIFGKVATGKSRWIQTPEASWLLYQSDPLQLILLGIAVAVPAAYFTHLLPNSGGIVFGFATILLVFMQFGFKVPVTHHIALSSSMITAATGNMAWGVAFGLVAVFLGEFFACLFVNHGDTHIDPPTMALVGTFTIYPLLELTGLFSFTGNIIWIIPVVIALTGYSLFTFLRKQPEMSANAIKV